MKRYHSFLSLLSCYNYLRSKYESHYSKILLKAKKLTIKLVTIRIRINKLY
jgi:hypothetical protein